MNVDNALKALSGTTQTSIIGALLYLWSQIPTHSDLRELAVKSDFQFAEVTIQLNEIQLNQLDQTGFPNLNPTEKRKYNNLIKEIARKTCERDKISRLTDEAVDCSNVD